MRPARPFFEPSATQSQFEFETPDKSHFHQESFSARLLCAQIPKVQKKLMA